VLVAVACAEHYVPPGASLSPETAARAESALAAASDRIEPIEGGLLLKEAYVQVTRWEPLVADPRDLPDELFGQEQEIRTLEGPRRLFVAWGDVLSVSARSDPFWSAVEITLVPPPSGSAPSPPSPLLIHADDGAQARALADALDLLLRSVRRRAP
jgi:hypothetical protein